MSTEFAEAFRATVKRNITEIPTKVSNTLTKVGNYTFCGCSNLTSISLPLCESVGISAFDRCGSLTSASLPACTSVSNYAFNICSKLTEIHFGAANQTAIEASSQYSSKWGAGKATIYFDL